MDIVDNELKEEFDATNGQSGIELAGDQVGDDYGGEGGGDAPANGF